MWERFSTSGLAGAYVDELLAAGRNAQMEFRPRRALDPYPFVVSVTEDDEAAAVPANVHYLRGSVRNAQPDPSRRT